MQSNEKFSKFELKAIYLFPAIAFYFGLYLNTFLKQSPIFIGKDKKKVPAEIYERLKKVISNYQYILSYFTPREIFINLQNDQIQQAIKERFDAFIECFDIVSDENETAFVIKSIELSDKYPNTLKVDQIKELMQAPLSDSEKLKQIEEILSK